MGFMEINMWMKCVVRRDTWPGHFCRLCLSDLVPTEMESISDIRRKKKPMWLTFQTFIPTQYAVSLSRSLAPPPRTCMHAYKYRYAHVYAVFERVGPFGFLGVPM